MDTYVSLLRGINVGGQKKIKMEGLIALYESLGFKNVRTHVQSGNVVFSAPKSNIKELSSMIEERIKEVFNFPVAVLLRTPSELQRIIDNNPFLEDKGIDTNKLYVTFLSNAPANSILSQIKEVRDESDKFVSMNREIYLYCTNGYGRTKFSNDFFEKELGVTATTRNWRTINTLLEIAQSHSD
jgi:uncharacterized protein (DUF1697 family)